MDKYKYQLFWSSSYIFYTEYYILWIKTMALCSVLHTALINLNQHGCEHVQSLVYYYIIISGQELS